MKYILTFILAVKLDAVIAFGAFGWAKNLPLPKRTRTNHFSTSIDSDIYSKDWSVLKTDLESILEVKGNKNSDDPVLTLYRDTNGWCPFCERVWLCITAKGLPYRERLIPLNDKPEWYKELVPTTLVPAVLFHGSTSDEGSHERRIVWESLDIMRALDEMFPSTKRLVLDTPEYTAARHQISALSSKGVALSYNSKNGTEAEKEEAKIAFLKELDELESELATSDGPFRLGSEFTGVDAEMVPLLERWRFQLPVSQNIDIAEGRPCLSTWFEAMDQFSPYTDRVAGDEYSWVATTSMFARYFGDTENSETQNLIKRADEKATDLSNSFKSIDDSVCEESFALEAAAKIISNHDAIIADCTSRDPKSQQHFQRSSSVDVADQLIRHVISLLLKGNEAIGKARSSSLDTVLTNDQKSDAALAARTIASRLCAPRDMSAPAAKILRAILFIIADKLEQ